jgi:hypothetical protein
MIGSRALQGAKPVRLIHKRTEKEIYFMNLCNIMLVLSVDFLNVVIIIIIIISCKG